MTRVTSDATQRALLTAMGHDVSTDESIAAEIARLDAAERSCPLDPAHVVPHDAPIPVRLRCPPHARATWRLELECEDGTRETREGRVEADHRGLVEIPFPFDAPPEGYHRLRASIRTADHETTSDQLLVVAPEACTPTAARLGDGKGFGIFTNLYTVRSATNWGIGDLGDLRRLAAWAHARGAAFVGVNPLHATGNRNGAVSPYSPTSRLYGNPIYLDVTAIPEWTASEEARTIADSTHGQRALAAVRERSHVDYANVWALKTRVLTALHRAFAEQHRGRATARGTAYTQFLERAGMGLDAFATFCALDEAFGDPTAPPDWRTWPVEYHEPHGGAVSRFARENAETVDRHRWLQFELSRQLEAAGAPLDARLGLYADVAVGSAPGGSDVWTWRSLFVPAATIGAPPDAYATGGQDWALPPIHPHRLRDDRYAYWIRLLRASLAHAGAIRLDHVMGLFRLFWIPRGRPASEGAYVRYPAEELLGILALESRRHGAVVVGEDLGTVPAEVPGVMRRRGLLASRVLYFQRGADGEFLPPDAYPADALATVATHDHVPLAGYWSGADLSLRRALGVSVDTPEERARDHAALARRLAADGGLSAENATPGEVLRATHALLARTPCVLVGAALDDLGGETEPVNVPGVGPERFPSWTRKMTRSLEEITAAPETARALEPLEARRVH